MVIVVIGAQWGDEGKGKIVDLLAERFDVVARYQGGHNVEALGQQVDDLTLALVAPLSADNYDDFAHK